MKIYERVRQICKDQGRSVAEIERAAGLSNGAISKWDESTPSVKNAAAVALALEVRIEDLIGGDDEHKPK